MPDPTPTPEIPPVEVPKTDVIPGTGEPVPDYKALYEKEAAERAKEKERLTALEKVEEDRKTAQLSEVEREKKRADAAETRAATLERAALINQIAAETGLSAEARALLSGADEAALRANAASLAAIQQQPIVAGTTTQPGGNATPTLDEKIASAEKNGDYAQSIALKRERAGW